MGGLSRSGISTFYCGGGRSVRNCLLERRCLGVDTWCTWMPWARSRLRTSFTGRGCRHHRCCRLPSVPRLGRRKALPGLQLEVDQSHTEVMQITHPREGNAPNLGYSASSQSKPYFDLSDITYLFSFR